MAGPKLSVIVPIYRCEEYIDECLQSVLNQSFKDFEVICVYDGEKIAGSNAEKYASDPRVRLIEKEHGGLSDTRNVGFSVAEGEYIYYLDSDDYVTEDAFERMVGHMESQELDVLNFNAETFVDGDPENRDNENRYRRDGYNVIGTFKGTMLIESMYRNKCYCSPVWLLCIRRSFYLDIGLTFRKGILHEDELFTYCCMTKAERSKWVPEVYNMHRVRPGSIMTTRFDHRNIDGYVRTYVDILRFNNSNDIDNRCLMTDRIAKLLMSRFNGIDDREKSRLTPLSEEEYKVFMECGDLDIIDDPRLLNSIVPEDRRLLDRLSKYIDRPAVSVVMPVFNAEYYLRETLDDILDQSVTQLELICVDDGSTDGSLAVLEEYASVHPNMKVFRQENLYAGVARNLGLDNVSGDYVIFLDSDDRFDRRMLEFALGSAFKYGSDAVIFEADTFDSVTGEHESSRWQFRKDLLNGDEVFSPREFKDSLYQITTGVPWNKLFRTEHIREKDLRFQEIQRSNDVYFVYSALSTAERISAVFRVLVHYRKNNVHSLQGTNSQTPLDFYHAFYATKQRLIEERSYLYLKNSFANACVRNCINNYDKQKTLESAIVLLVHFKDHIFEDLDVFNIPDHSVFYQSDLKKLEEMGGSDILGYLRDTGRTSFVPSMDVSSEEIIGYLKDYAEACFSGKVDTDESRSERLSGIVSFFRPSTDSWNGKAKAECLEFLEGMKGKIESGTVSPDQYIEDCLSKFDTYSDIESAIHFLVYFKYGFSDTIGDIPESDEMDSSKFDRFTRMRQSEILDFLVEEGRIGKGLSFGKELIDLLSEYNGVCNGSVVEKDLGKSIQILETASLTEPSLRYRLCEVLLEDVSLENVEKARGIISALESEGIDTSGLSGSLMESQKKALLTINREKESQDRIANILENGTSEEVRSYLESIREDLDLDTALSFIRAFKARKGGFDIKDTLEVCRNVFEYGGLGVKDAVVSELRTVEVSEFDTEAVKMALTLDSDKSKTFLAEAYSKGKGVSKDLPKALEFINGISDETLAADIKIDILWPCDDPTYDKELFKLVRRETVRRNRGRLQYLLGEMYLHGRGTVRNKALAVDAFSRCNLPEAQKEINDILFNSEDEELIKAIFDVYTDLSNSGDKVNTARLAHMYHIGRGTEKNLVKAAELLNRPGVNSTPWTHCELFDVLWELKDHTRDQEMYGMIESYSRETRNPQCVRRLGKCFLMGRGVKRDFDRGMLILKESGTGDEYHLVFNALKNDNSPEAREIVFRYSMEGAMKGDMLCMARVGHAYHVGSGVEKDLNLAAEWMQKALPRGDKWIVNEYNDILSDTNTPDADEENIRFMVERVKIKKSKSNVVGLAKIFAEGRGLDSDFRKILPLIKTYEGLPIEDRIRILFREGSEDSRKEAYGLLGTIDVQKYGFEGYVARMYNDDIYEGKDPIKAFGLYRKAVDSGNNQFRIELLDLMWSFNDPRSDREYFARIKTYGIDDPAMEIRMGRVYCFGRGVEQDMEKGMTMLDSAVEKNISLTNLREQILTEISSLTPESSSDTQTTTEDV